MPLSQDADRLLRDAVNLQIDTVVKSAMPGRARWRACWAAGRRGGAIPTAAGWG
jgi:hypothetical protein